MTEEPEAVEACQALLASLVTLAEARPAKSGSKKASKVDKNIEKRRKRQEAKKGTEPTKAEKKEEEPVETPQAAVAESIELEYGWEKVPEKTKRTQTWNVRSADWTAEVLEMEKLAEGIHDPNRAAISAVTQVKDGESWLELQSLVASAESDGKPLPR